MSVRFLALLVTAAAAFAEPVLTLPFDAYRNLVWFRANVNDRGPAWLLFDSAAGSSTISRRLTQQLGLEHLQFATATAGGAGPAHVQVPVLRDVTFSIEGLRFTPPQLPSIPLDRVDALFGRHIEAILGKDLLRRYVLEFDSVARQVRLYEPGSYSYGGKGLILPIRIADGPIFEAAIRIPPGRTLPCRLMMDTAAGAALIFTAPFAKQWRLPDGVRSLSERLMPSQGGGVGGMEPTTIGRLESVEIGSYSIVRPVVRFPDARGGSYARTDFDATIGMELLRRFRVIVDYLRERIILEPNESLAEAMESDMSGLRLEAAGSDLEEIVIADVYPDTPASAADLRPGDRIVSVDGRKPASLWDAQKALSTAPGRTVVLKVQRHETQREVHLTLRRFV